MIKRHFFLEFLIKMLRRCLLLRAGSVPLPPSLRSDVSGALQPPGGDGTEALVTPSASPATAVAPAAAAPVAVVVCTLLPGGGYMRTAMERLGMAPYSLFDAIHDGRHMTHPAAWQCSLQQDQPLPAAMLAGKDCLVGPPGASAVRQLVAAYPSSSSLKFILVQETDKEQLAPRLHVAISEYYNSFPKLLAPKARDLVDLVYPSKSERVSATGLSAYEELIIGRVPPGRLLLYSYGDGWEPLCDFLGRDLPPETEQFPEYCDGVKDLHMRSANARKRSRMAFAGMAICIIAMSYCVARVIVAARDLGRDPETEQVIARFCPSFDSSTTSQSQAYVQTADAARGMMLGLMRDVTPSVYRPVRDPRDCVAAGPTTTAAHLQSTSSSARN